jgi:hypothetical protein
MASLLSTSKAIVFSRRIGRWSIKIDSASYIDIASYTLPSTVSGDSASACAPMSSSNNNFSCSLSSSNGLRFGTTHTH